MLGMSRMLTSRLAPIVALQARHKGTVPIITITHRIPYTDRTMGPYPNTPEERLKAARKYNLIPEDYEPYDEDEGWGDYPKLPLIGAYNRDKYDDFDDIFHCRHYGEPLHRDFDLYTWERMDPLEEAKNLTPMWPYWKRFLYFAGAFFVMPLWVYFFETFNININQPWKISSYNLGRPKYGFPDSPNDHPHHHHASDHH